ncbi:universal stress protein [Sagittula stellata]|uniref:Universal stress protein family protein n=1 Tax=Sagittula stellata (strain ATCC 700073 / DSM 11524 / E-37) TaxID=388399 RepID=A3KA93_SAGS3|nr:universal stress protein [Sagittula stellata]EBA05884.1 universal stress protein family protein [Sagittula stellata E-37]
MTGKFVVGFDGSETAQRALDFATERAIAQGGTIVVAYVLEWSPYSFLTPQEVAERSQRRKDELARAETAIIEPAQRAAEAKGVRVETVLRYGHIAEIICEIAEAPDVAQIFIGRNGRSSLGSRVFGSVAGHLVQASPVPCTIVP